MSTEVLTCVTLLHDYLADPNNSWSAPIANIAPVTLILSFKVMPAQAELVGGGAAASNSGSR